MKGDRKFQPAWALVVLALAACAAGSEAPAAAATAGPPPELRLTINGEGCTLDGPTAVPFGEFVMTLVIDLPEVSETGYALLVLDEGKSIKDLEAWTSGDYPEWADRLTIVNQTEAGTSDKTIDLAPKAAMADRSEFYIGCFHTDPQTHVRKMIGAHGPIQVDK
jgi:hypothetical protein